MNLWSIKEEGFYHEDLLSHLPLEKILHPDLYFKTTYCNHKCITQLAWERASESATAFWMNQVCTWHNRPGVWIPYVRLPHLVFQPHLHSSHLRNLPAQFSNQAPALSNESPISKHGSPFPLSGIPSHLLSISIHPIYRSNCNLPLKPSLLAWVIILNYWHMTVLFGRSFTES